MGNKTVTISNKCIGENHAVFFIAEIGINHNGDIQLAKRLIDAAFACGWDCAKFQKRTPAVCVPEHQKNVMRDTPWGQMTYLDYRYKVEFEKKEYDYIDKYCKEKPIMWTASAWDVQSLHFLLEYDVPFIKIPSAKLIDRDFIKEAAVSKRLVMLSTGMSTTEEIDLAVNVLEKHSDGKYVLMHTNSTYPTPPADINLQVIKTFKERYGCIIGYSGHEYDLEPTVIAVALGARVIERHITINHNMWGSDHFASLEVHGMDMLSKRVRDIDIMMGDGVKKVGEKELEVRKKLRGC